MRYYAKLKKEGGSIIVTFPDLPNVNTCGNTTTEALKNAGEALNGALQADFSRGFELPKAQVFKGR
jgi:predicted RNase H-like HicB family nuclease